MVFKNKVQRKKKEKETKARKKAVVELGTVIKKIQPVQMTKSERAFYF